MAELLSIYKNKHIRGITEQIVQFQDMYIQITYIHHLRNYTFARK